MGPVKDIYHLDARHLLCPLPVIRTQSRIAKLGPGDILEILCTDPGAMIDIPAWCRIHGHTVVGSDKEGATIKITIKVGGE